MQMTLDEMFAYIKRFNGMDFNKEDLQKAEDIEKKLINLIKTFGFERNGSHLGHMYNYGYHYDVAKRKGEREIYWFKLRTEGHDYIKISIGVSTKSKEYGRGRNKKKYVVAYKGVCHVEEVKVPINPNTGEPWKIGDVDSSNPNYTRVLTKNGWWSGD